MSRPELLTVLRLLLVLLIPVCAGVGCTPAVSAGGPRTEHRTDDPEEILFGRDILPILSEHCFQCHGPDAESREAELRLDLETDAARVLGREPQSESLLLSRVLSSDPDLVMPPPSSHRDLAPEQRDLLKKWIANGSPWGTHWAFRPLTLPPVPELPNAPANGAETSDTAVSPQSSPRHNPIDAFVQRRLRKEGIPPAPEADRAVLLRRVTLDLTGLPPTRSELTEFLADSSPDAYENAVDRLLASEAYGERMAWDWLEAARYADSNGYQGDRERTMYPWRDWVVRAFNENMPFDRFTVVQLAGDLLPDAGTEELLATGFCRNHMINGEGGRIAEENRVDYVMDMAETAGTVWLGLTFNCCRCHDHKYDPLTQREYYSLFAFFNQTPVNGGGGDPQTPPVLPVPSAEQQRKLDELTALIEALAPGEAQDAERTRLTEEKKKLEGSIPRVMVMADLPSPRETFMLTRGLYNQPTEVRVTPVIPAALPQPSQPPRNRLDLARWLVSDQQPLTPRVTVNRFWQQLFGIGLVRTSEDFGVQGERPLHPELLNWLAADFRDHGWNVKRLMRQIVTSHTYRQDSGMPLAQDPENRLLARGARYRMPSWMLRDHVLAVSGLLDDTIGGRPVNTYQPEGVWEEATFGNKKYHRGSGSELYRRSLYVFWRRIIGPTMFFDVSSRQQCTVRTGRTNTPLHALLTLNDTTWVEASRVLAQQLLLAPNLQSDEERIRELFLRVVCREAAAEEITVLLNALRRRLTEFRENPAAAEDFLGVGESPRDPSVDPVLHAAWTGLCLTVLNLDEALTRS